MATDHNFKVKNGLTVLGDTLVVNHTGDVSGTQVYIKKKDSSTNLMRWGEGTSGATTYKWRIDQSFDFVGNNGSDVIVLKSSNGSIQGQSFKIGSTTIIDSSRNLTNIGTISNSGNITSTGNVTITGGNSDGSGNAFVVNRGGGSQQQALRVENSGEVVVANNYLYASMSGTSFYSQGDAVIRGNLRNDSNGGADPLKVSDKLNVTGDIQSNGTVILESSGRNLTNIGTISSGAISTSANLDMNANDIIDVNQINGTGGTGWLDFNMDTDNVYPQASTDNQTVLGSITHMNFVGDSNGNGTGGIFYWGYGVNNADSGTFTQTMSLDRSAVLKIGLQNTNSGSIDLYGGSAGAEGGEIRLHVTNGYDSTYEWYRIDAYQDDFRIGRQGQTDLTIDQTGKANFGGLVSCDDGFQINGTTVIDSSRNLVNIGTINTGQGATEVYLMNQNVRSSDSPTFQDLTVQGNLNITGDINSYNITDLDVVDKTITLGVGGSASTNDGGGIVVDGANAKLTWNNTGSYWQMNKKLAFNDTATTTNQGLGLVWTGFDKEGTSDSTDTASIVHTTNTGGHTGSVLLITSQNDANDGIAFTTNSSSYLKHNSSNILTAANALGQLGITATATELNYTDGVTSNIQTQLNARTTVSTSGYNGTYNIPIHHNGVLYTTPTAGAVQITGSSGQISTPSHGNSSQWNTAYGWGNHASEGYLTSSSSLNAANLTGTINTARLPNPIQLSGGNAIIKLQETDVTNSPNWWHVADGGNYSIRLNNTGTYPFQIISNGTNDAVSRIVLGYNTDFSAGIDVTGNITVTGTVDGVDIQTLNTTAGAALPKAGGTMTGAVTMAGQTWNGDITWNNGKNILVGGESSIDVSGSGYFQVWDGGAGAAFIKCDVGVRTEIGIAGSRGLKVHGEMESSSLDVNGNGDISGALNVGGNLTIADQIRIGDDAWIEDFDVANSVRIKGNQANNQGYIAFGQQTAKLGCNNTSTLSYNGNNLIDSGGNIYGTSLYVTSRKVLDLQSNSSNSERGPWNPLVTMLRGAGRKLHVDEDFASGSNGVNVYNNSGGGTVTHTREDATTNSGGNAPNSSGKVIRINHNGGTSSPGFGGFVQNIPSEDNHTFVQIFQAKLPTGKNLVLAENAQGSNNKSYFLTDTAGTGKWEWYARVSHCGQSGSFSSGGHIYVTGGSGNFNWYLASCTVIDVTESYSISNRMFHAQTVASNSQPLYSFNSDTDTGLGYIGSNAVGLIAGASRKMYVNSSNAYFQNISGGVIFDNVPAKVITGNLAVSDAGTKGLIFDGNYTTGQYRHRFRKQDPGSGLPLYIDYAHGTANSYTNIARFGGGGTYKEFSVYGDEEITGVTTYGPNPGWSKYLKIGGNGNNSDANTGSIGVTNGNLHIDAANGSFATYLNFYDGTGGVAFGSGGTSAVAWMGPDGDLWKGSSDNSGSKYWHAGNDGPSSGLNADLLDDQHGSYYLNTSSTAQTKSGILTLSGGLIVDGSTASGGTDYGFYQNAGTNIVLKGDSNGRSGIFFQSEKNGTNINHPSDYGFIQFHPYGYGNTSGEVINMVIGTANDSNDQLILQTPWTTGLKFGYRNSTSGTGLTTGNIWHFANDGDGSGLSADDVDGFHATSFARKGNVGYQSYTDLFTFPSNSSGASTAGDQSSIQIYNGTAGNDAFMAFHVSSDYAGYFGLDGTTNDLFWGGWSRGAAKYKIWHAANDGAGSGLSADDVDGYTWSDQTKNVAWRQGTTEAGNNNGIGFWGNTSGAAGSYAIYMSAHNGTYGGRVTGDAGNSDYNMYFKMSAGTNRGFVFKNGSTNVFGIDGAGRVQVTGDIYGKYVNGAYSNLYRFGGLYLGWDNDNYGVQFDHSLTSSYGGTYGDDITLNSYHRIRLNIDSNNNNGLTTEAFEIGHNTSGTGNRLFQINGNALMTLGYDGKNPLFRMEYDNNHGNGDRWDTLIEIGRSNEFQINDGSYPLYEPANAGHYGMKFQGNSDAVFYGAEQYTSGHYRPVIAWGDDTTDSPFFFRYNWGTKFAFTYNGIFHADNDVIAYSTTTSDARFKDNVSTIENALDKVQKLRGVEFDWNATSRKGKHDIGFIAQEIEEVIPEVVTEQEMLVGDFEEKEEKAKTVAYGQVTALLVEAIKEQQETINKLIDRINDLEKGE